MKRPRHQGSFIDGFTDQQLEALVRSPLHKLAVQVLSVEVDDAISALRLIPGKRRVLLAKRVEGLQMPRALQNRERLRGRRR